jgi:hypothetical protein
MWLVSCESMTVIVPSTRYNRVRIKLHRVASLSITGTIDGEDCDASGPRCPPSASRFDEPNGNGKVKLVSNRQKIDQFCKWYLMRRENTSSLPHSATTEAVEHNKGRSLVTIYGPRCVAVFPNTKTRHLVKCRRNAKKKQMKPFSLLRSHLSLYLAALREENAGIRRATLVRNRIVVSCRKKNS